MKSGEDSHKQHGYWQEKPLWCQPWSIIFTGLLIIITTFTLFHNIIIESLVSIFTIAWWYLFLFIAPQAFDEIIQGRIDE